MVYTPVIPSLFHYEQQSCSEQKTPPILSSTVVFSPQDWINPISTFRVIISSQVSFNASTWQLFKTPCHVLEGQNPSSDVKGWDVYFSTKRYKNNSDSNDHLDVLKCLGVATEHMYHHTHTRIQTHTHIVHLIPLLVIVFVSPPLTKSPNKPCFTCRNTM